MDIVETAVHVRPLTEPTDLSMSISRYKMFNIFNKLYKDSGGHLQSREFVQGIESELKRLEEDLPWFFKVENIGEFLSCAPELEVVAWSFHLLHSCLCLQRLRMYRPFLQERTPETWDRCVKAAESALDVYKALRAQDLDSFRQSPKFRGGNGYQTFSVATFLGLFLLIENPDSPDRIRADLDLVLADFGFVTRQSDCSSEERENDKVLRYIAESYDSKLQSSGLNSGTIVGTIYSVFGGETSSHAYLGRAKERRVARRDAHQNHQETAFETSLQLPGSEQGTTRPMHGVQTQTQTLSLPRPPDNCIVEDYSQPRTDGMISGYDSADISLDLWGWEQLDGWDSILDSFVVNCPQI